VVLAGGMESMSNVPYCLPQARTGYRLGNGALVDGMIHDGLWDPYNNFHMGSAGELCARECQIDRERQDGYAAESYRRAQAAVAEGLFRRRDRRGVGAARKKGEPLRLDDDEEPGRGNISKLGTLRPAFDKSGSITAGNASTINDGAAALVVMSAEAAAQRRGSTPLARIVGQAGAAQAPEWFTTARDCVDPAPAREDRSLGRRRRSVGDQRGVRGGRAGQPRRLGIAHERLNVRGGAIALGHPIGCSGARVLTPCCTRCVRPASAAASRRCASAAARRSR
jgi:acetyl-CoA C-acetyltransferase